MFFLTIISINLIYTNSLSITKKTLTDLTNNSITSPNVNYFSAQMPNCNVKTCIRKFGKCQSDILCVCAEGYAHVPKVTNGIACSYKQKRQITAFLLELFIMGAGHIYRGSIILGVLKILFVVLFPCMLLYLVFLGIIVESDIKSQTCFLIGSIVVTVLYLFGVIIWYLYDVINLGLNKYTDGHGVPLQHW